MTEEKHNPKGEQVPYGASKKINRDILKWIIIGLTGFIVVILAFGAGIKVGEIKARYSYRWAENYHKNFGGPKAGFFGDWRSFPRGDLIEGHGSFGEIIEVNNDGFVIKGREDIEKIIVTTKDTVIKKGMETVKDGLKVGDNVVVIGSPNEQGQIEAKLIRFFSDEPKQLPDKNPRSRFF